MIYIIYHKNCNDGTASAHAAWLKFGDNAKYIPMMHGDVMPEMPDLEYLYIVDFSFKHDVMMQLHNDYPNKVMVIDHHKTAEADLAGVPNCIFDMKKSGAVLSWEYFQPGKKLPKFYEYIQDYDLWTKALPYTEEATVYINSFERTIAKFDSFISTFEHFFENVAREGGAMLRFHTRDIDKVCASARKHKWDGEIDCMIVNTPAFFASDVGDALARKNPDAKFVCCYSDTHEGFRYYSLRSKGEFDVSKIAAKFGGGGHKNASGFLVKVSTPLFF
jgi:oligoribonuclease NrnB/cAMP/cGMP phosphodiesterase (DHH superfamily)